MNVHKNQILGQTWTFDPEWCLSFRESWQIVSSLGPTYKLAKFLEIINLTFCKQVEVNEAWWCHNLAFLSHFLNPFWKHLSFSGFYGRNYCNWKIAAVPCISRRLSNALDFCLTATRLSLHRWAKKILGVEALRGTVFRYSYLLLRNYLTCLVVIYER